MYLDEVKARFSSLGVLRREKVVSCTEEEVRSMEDTLGFFLPAAYREFLLMKELHLQLPRWYVNFRRWLTDFRNARG